MKKPRISYREWLGRDPVTPGRGETPVPSAEEQRAADGPESGVESAPAAVVETAPEAGVESAPEAVVNSVAEAVAESVPESVAVAEATPEPPAPSGTPTAGGGGPERAAEPVEGVEHLVFRVARELFAVPLDGVEEALDIDRIQPIPQMSPTMLGVLTLRGAAVPLYAAAAPLGLAAESNRAALIFLRGQGAVALAVDDVDDVLVIAAGDVRRAPVDFGDSVLLGVIRRGTDLIGVLDPEALIGACRIEPVLEGA